MDMNRWIGCGRITKDAERSESQNGNTKVKFRMAVNDRRSDDTLFINILVFGKMADALGEYLTGGRMVCVEGKLKVKDYEDKDGVAKTSICVMADEISLGPVPKEKLATTTVGAD